MNHSHSPIPRVAAINDLSGFGRCSLTVAIPVLSAMGVQCCPLPTAILSQHTGFDRFFFSDFTPHLPEYIESWRSQGIEFDTVYSGFLGSQEQIHLVDRFIDTQKNALIFVDPVMGDRGKVYATYTPEMCGGMRTLVSKASIVTPNITEACLLTDTAYPGESPDRDTVKMLAEKVGEMGPRYIVVTGIQEGRQITSLAYDKEERTHYIYSVERTEMPLMGTGDIFASVLCGGLTKGEDLLLSLRLACDFVRDTTRYTMELRTPPLDGVTFEPFLYRLGGSGNGKQ